MYVRLKEADVLEVKQGFCSGVVVQSLGAVCFLVRDDLLPIMHCGPQPGGL